MNAITRRQLAGGAVAGLAGGWSPTADARSGARPRNILWLMSDQHRPGALGVDGNAVAHTPNLDQFALESTRFDRAYCTNPVCVPSRASLLTGLYTHHHRTWSNGTPWPVETRTIAHHLGQAGYMSALIGKMHFVDAQTHGFDYHLDFNDWILYLGPKTKLFADEVGKRNSGCGLPQIGDLWHDFGDPWTGAREDDGRKGLAAIGRVSKLAERDHFESFVTRESIRFLQQHGKRQPFLLIASYLKPHDPFMPAERFARMFRPERMHVPETWGKVDLQRVPAEIRDRIQNDSITPELRNNPEGVRRRIAFYYANLAQMDDNVGAVLRALRETGLDRDTIVIYTTDHGEMLGEHGLFQKMVFYEPAAGVPLIFKVPGLTHPGARCGSLVSQASLLATLLDLCGIAAPGGLDGESLVPYLREPGRVGDATVYSEYALQTPHAKYMVRYGDWKYSFYVSDTPELYDLKKDPLEMRNLAGEPAHEAKLKEMRERLFAWHRPAEMQ